MALRDLGLAITRLCRPADGWYGDAAGTATPDRLASRRHIGLLASRNLPRSASATFAGRNKSTILAVDCGRLHFDVVDELGRVCHP